MRNTTKPIYKHMLNRAFKALRKNGFATCTQDYVNPKKEEKLMSFSRYVYLSNGEKFNREGWFHKDKSAMLYLNWNDHNECSDEICLALLKAGFRVEHDGRIGSTIGVVISENMDAYHLESYQFEKLYKSQYYDFDPTSRYGDYAQLKEGVKDEDEKHETVWTRDSGKSLATCGEMMRAR